LARNLSPSRDNRKETKWSTGISWSEFFDVGYPEGLKFGRGMTIIGYEKDAKFIASVEDKSPESH
jgi:hypothetical protein